MKRVGFATLVLFAGTASVAPPRPAAAHEASVTVVELSEVQSGRFSVRITGSQAQLTETPTPIFPEHCTYTDPLLECGKRGLVGTLSLERLGASQSAALFRIRYTTGRTQVHTVTPAQPTLKLTPIGGTEGFERSLRVVQAYLVIGIEHILLGVDHLVFVLGLIWLVRSRWLLIQTITAFTVAHSITLAVVTVGWVGVPERLVNALIALSIVFVGVEVVRLKRGEVGLTARQPWIVSFAFGLLHGFGFASALTTLGLPSDSLPLALVSFNVGVEIGQVAFVLLVVALGWAYRTLGVIWPRRAELVPPYAMGAIASFWTLDRVTRMFSG